MAKDDRDPYDYDRIFDEPLGKDPTVIERIPKRLAIKVGSIIIVVIVLLSSLVYVKHQFSPTGNPGNELNVEVAKGASFSDVAAQLADKNIIPSALFLKLYVKIHGGAPTVKAGEYAFNLNSSDGAAVAVLKKGPKAPTDKLVIPEGLRLSQIAERVGAIPGLSAQKFYTLATSGSIRSDLEPAGSNNLEGLLFPDTYLLSGSDTETTLLQRMINEFETEESVLNLSSSVSTIGHSPYETIIIASMIESEAKVPGDRGKVSQVIENRLFKAMKLQIDATVLYAMGNTKQSLSLKDLQYQSPYNTYLHMGLPPTPISSPGAAAIQAALQPTPGPWLYYVVTGADGSESFSTTLDQQNANIALAKSRGLN